MFGRGPSFGAPAPPTRPLPPPQLSSAQTRETRDPFFSTSCALFASLFCTRATPISFPFNRFRTLYAKLPGVTQSVLTFQPSNVSTFNLSPLESALTDRRSVTPLESALTKKQAGGQPPAGSASTFDFQLSTVDCLYPVPLRPMLQSAKMESRQATYGNLPLRAGVQRLVDIGLGLKT